MFCLKQLHQHYIASLPCLDRRFRHFTALPYLSHCLFWLEVTDRPSFQAKRSAQCLNCRNKDEEREENEGRVEDRTSKGVGD